MHDESNVNKARNRATVAYYRRSKISDPHKRDREVTVPHTLVTPHIPAWNAQSFRLYQSLNSTNALDLWQEDENRDEDKCEYVIMASVAHPRKYRRTSLACTECRKRKLRVSLHPNCVTSIKPMVLT